MVTLSFAEISSMLGTFLWPFVRIGAMLFAAPIFGAQNFVPVRVRVGLIFMITVAIYPTLSEAPAVEVFSLLGLVITIQQFILGIMMGFILQMAFATLVVAGQSIALTTGLGFATFVDPANGVQVPVVSQFYTLVGTLLFLSLNGHLAAIQVLVESFQTIPVGVPALTSTMFLDIVTWGGKIYSGAMLIALPAVVSISLINLAFGVMSRAAPQLNIFAVGFPTTMAVGYLIMFLTVPTLLPRFTQVVMDAFDLIHKVLGG